MSKELTAAELKAWIASHPGAFPPEPQKSRAHRLRSKLSEMSLADWIAAVPILLFVLFWMLPLAIWAFIWGKFCDGIIAVIATSVWPARR